MLLFSLIFIMRAYKIFLNTSFVFCFVIFNTYFFCCYYIVFALILLHIFTLALPAALSLPIAINKACAIAGFGADASYDLRAT